MAELNSHQRKIVERYYDHRDEIMLNKLAEIASELYLAESESKLKQLWGRAEKAMKQLKVPAAISAHILASRQPELLASHLRGWLDAAKRTPQK